MFQIGQKNCVLCYGHMLSVILMVEKLLEFFLKKLQKKKNQKKFRVEKVFKEKGDKLYVKWKGYDISFNI